MNSKLARMNKKRNKKPFTDAQAFERVRARCRVTESGCWEAPGQKPGKWGYTQCNHGGKRWMTHRLMYTIAKGPIPDGYDVLHRCDNPPCCNPDHLWAGTQRENSLDMAAKGRTAAQRRPTCTRGHPYDDENTTRYGKNGWRDCKICARARNRIKAGWPEDLAYSMDAVPHGYRPVNAKFPRKRKAA